MCCLLKENTKKDRRQNTKNVTFFDSAPEWREYFYLFNYFDSYSSYTIFYYKYRISSCTKLKKQIYPEFTGDTHAVSYPSVDLRSFASNE